MQPGLVRLFMCNLPFDSTYPNVVAASVVIRLRLPHYACFSLFLSVLLSCQKLAISLSCVSTCVSQW